VTIYVYRGEVSIAGEKVATQRLAVLANGVQDDGLEIEATDAARAQLIAGRPLHEPIAQYGPFVKNTEQEIYQALNDFRDGCLVS